MLLQDLPLEAAEWDLAFPVLQQLRDHLDRPGFDAVHRAGAAQGLRFTAVLTETEPPACLGVAGWRLMDTASVVRKLFVDDLVVDEGRRSQGIGTLLLDHLEQVARDAGARCVELDSGHQRTDAHRFYRARGYKDTGLKFRKDLTRPA